MCILKALLFAAGLILGFESFAKREIDYRVETAFGSARKILEFFAIQSSQAAHYYDILTLLANAIEKRREQLLDKGRSSHVSRIFPISIAQERMQATTMTEDTSSMRSGAVNEERLDRSNRGDGVLDILGEYFDQDSEDFLVSDALDLSQWDGFPFMAPIDLDT